MAEVVYLLCAATSVTCALLLLRAYRQERARLLLWSGLCFVCLALNNILVFVDLVMVPEINLQHWRSGVALAGMVVLLWGLIWESA